MNGMAVVVTCLLSIMLLGSQSSVWLWIDVPASCWRRSRTTPPATAPSCPTSEEGALLHRKRASVGYMSLLGTRRRSARALPVAA